MNTEPVAVRGVLTRSVATRKTRNGDEYSIFTIQDTEGREKRVQTRSNIHPDIAREFFTKGRRLKVIGFPRESQWITEDGQKRTKSYIFATEVEVISEYGKGK